MSLVPFLLHQAKVSLWPAGPDGSALTGFPIWFGACSDYFNAQESHKEQVGSASGRPYRRGHVADLEWELELGRLWALPGEALADFRPDPGAQHVLQVLWYDPVRNQGFQRCWFGVTLRTLDNRSKESKESRVRQVFRAEQMAEAPCGRAAAPLSFPQPLTVWYVRDGLRVHAYNYDSASATFTAATPNITELVTVTNNPISVAFATTGDVWLTWNGTQLVVPSAKSGSGVAIPKAERIEFRRGRRALAMFSGGGLLKIHRYSAAAPSGSVGSAGFDFRHGGSLVATLDDTLTCLGLDADTGGSGCDCDCEGGAGDPIDTECGGTVVIEVPTPALQWNANHNLGRYPSVTTVDSAGTTILGDVHYLDVNNIRIDWAVPVSGKIFLN